MANKINSGEMDVMSEVPLPPPSPNVLTPISEIVPEAINPKKIPIDPFPDIWMS